MARSSNVVVAIAAIALLGGCASTGPASSVVGSAGSQTAPGGSAGLARFDRDGLAFDYPSGWTVTGSGLNEHYITILDFLGSGTGSAGCMQITPGPSDAIAGGTSCGTSIALDPGDVVVELSSQDGPGLLGSPIDPSNATLVADGGSFVTVGGLPAVAQENPDRPFQADLVLSWMLSAPASVNRRYQLDAYARGPGVDALRAQIEALVASIAFDPPVPVLPPADAPRALAAGLAALKANDPSFGCFPPVPGASATATVTQFPFYTPLRRPLAVTCSSAIEANRIGVWRATLTIAWPAGPGYPADRLVVSVWLAADGTPGETTSGPGPSQIPYWP